MWRPLFDGRLPLLLIALTTLILPTSARATFEIYPEFQMLEEGEVSGFDSTRLIDSEYQSDVVSYLKPLEWDARYFEATNAFDFTLGSLSSSLFLRQTRLKAAKRITPNTDVRVTYFNQQDLDIDQTHLILEATNVLFPQKLPQFRLSLYGQASFFKRENDIGLAVLYSPHERHEIRVFHTWVDFTRGAHSDRPDYFAEGGEPTAYGIVGRCIGCFGQEWLEYYVRRESKTTWVFPQTESEYRYENFSAGGAVRVSFPGTSWMNQLRGQYSRKEESVRPLSAASTVNEFSLTRDLVEVLGSVEIPADRVLGARSKFEPGLGWFQRLWKAGDGTQLDERNLLPFAWLRFSGMQRGPESFDTISLGYEVTFFDSDGASSPLASPELKSWAVEHRLNLRYEFALEGNALLSFFVSADADVIAGGEGGLFEGGNGQFRVFF